MAGNVAGHMAQAGMAQEHTATPANIFAFYVPDTHHPHHQAPAGVPELTHSSSGSAAVLEKLHSFPVTTNVVEYPRAEGASKVHPNEYINTPNTPRPPNIEKMTFMFPSGL